MTLFIPLAIVDEDLIKKILFAIFTLITALIIVYFQKSLEKKEVETKDNNRVKFELERAEMIEKINDNLRLNYNADRSSIWVIHNGQVVANNIHLYKMTMMWESVQNDIPKVREVSKDHKIMDFMDLWRPLLNNSDGKVIIKEDQFEDSDNSELAKLVRIHGIKDTIILLITDVFGSPLGIVSLAWIRKSIDVDTIDTKKLFEASFKLSGVLSQTFSK